MLEYAACSNAVFRQIGLVSCLCRVFIGLYSVENLALANDGARTHVCVSVPVFMYLCVCLCVWEVGPEDGDLQIWASPYLGRSIRYGANTQTVAVGF